MILNPVVYGSGGGDKPVLLVTVTGHAAISVTASKSGVNVSLTYDSTLGKWWAFLPSTGAWTVTASNEYGYTVTDTVSVNNVSVYELSLALSILPSGYTELEYLQSSGTQYIATDISPNQYLKTELDIMHLTSSLETFFGADIIPDNVFTNLNRCILGNRNSGENNVWYGTAGYLDIRTPANSFALNQKHHIVISSLNENNAPSISIDNVNQTLSITTGSQQFPPKSNKMYLFTLNRNGSALAQGNFKIYSGMEVSNASGIISKFYAAKRNGDNVLGMYDVILDKFYTNAGTGTFIGGPEIAAAA